MNTVLVATERDLEQNVLAQALDSQGYQIIRSRDGLDALEAARNKSPQVLLVNVALPKLDGFALFRRFQQDDQLRRIPIVLFSTRSNDQKSERFAMELGATQFVGNALKPGALNGVIEAALAAKPPRPLPKIQPVKKQQLAEESVGNTVVASAAAKTSGTNVVAIDRTLKLPALIALPDSEQIEQLQAEQQQLQKALQATQQQLLSAQGWRELFGLSPVAMWVINRATQKIMAVNAAALKLFAYSHDEFMQLDSPALLREPSQANTTNVFGFRSKDGRSLSLLVNSSELLMDTQPAELWVAHDVGYRVRGERAMAEEVQRVKALLAAMPIAYCVIDADAKLRDLNTACSALFGIGREQLLEQNLDRVLADPQQLQALKVLTAGQSLVASVRQAEGSQRAVQFTAGQHAFGAGLRLFALQAEREPTTVELPSLPQSSSKLPLVLEVLRYAEDADENTLLHYAMAQLANAFESPLALFASVERITQTLNLVAVNHAQANRRQSNTDSIAVPTPWLGLLAQRATAIAAVPDETLTVAGLPEIASYAACSVTAGRELWLLAIANRDTAYTATEQRELQECAEILVAALMQKRQQSKILAQAQRSAASTQSMLGLLDKLMDGHDVYAAGSGHRVASLALAVGKQMGLPESQCNALGLAARLHDVGNLSLPKSLLLQPMALSDAERTLMQGHVAYGVRLLNGVDLGADVAGIVEQHHERLDGSGYPGNLFGDQIRIEARILAVADVLEALSSARPHRPALSMQAALAELRRGAGKEFDAAVVGACEAVMANNEGQWPS